MSEAKLNAAIQLFDLVTGGRASPSRVAQALEKYRKAPGRALPRNMPVSSDWSVKDLLDEAAFLAHGKPFHRYPKFKNLVSSRGPAPLTSWVNGSWATMQRAKRTGVAHVTGVDARMNAGMTMYLSRHALRAPTRPDGAPSTPLYRGVWMTFDQLHKLMASGTWPDSGYQAFTRSKAFAIHWLSIQPRQRQSVPMLFVLKQQDVQPGTPWIWFQDVDMLRTDSKVVRILNKQCETVLPPGTLRVLGKIRYEDSNDDLLSADVQFVQVN